MQFSELKLNKQLLNAIADQGFDAPTPIQEKVIPLAMNGHDIIGVAQTIGATINPEWQILAGHIAFLVVLSIKPRGLMPRAFD